MKGDVVLVTGSSEGGIGYALCKAFAAKQCRVFASARRLEAMEGLLELGIETLILDVTSEDSVKEAVDTVIQRAGRIDVLVNNAGAGVVGPIAELPISAMKSNFDINVFGVVAVVQAVVPHMMQQGSGRIVNIGSVVGFLSTPWNGTYSAAKAAVQMLTDALRVELRPFGLKVVLVAPGGIRSNIGKNNIQGLGTRTWRFYQGYAKFIEARAVASQSTSSTPTDVFAANVVEAVMKPNPPRHFLGGSGTVMMYVLRYVPLWLYDWLVSRKFGLSGPKK